MKMNDMISSKKWILRFGCGVFGLLFLMITVAFFVDPLFKFRMNSSYHQPGINIFPYLIKNYEYDTLIVGSSMTQNFDLELFAEELQCDPFLVGIGGLNTKDMLKYVKTAYKTQKAQRYYLCVDLYYFTTDEAESIIPSYLLEDDLLADLEYLLSYDVWFHYLPVDLGIIVLDHLGVRMPGFIKRVSEIDLKRFSYDADSFTYGREVVLENYSVGNYSVSRVNVDDLNNRMKSNIDKFIDQFDFHAGQHIFFFPPYSSLYWCDAEDMGYFEAYMSAKAYFEKKACENGAEVFDFQAAELTMNLDNYKDTTHYSPEVNDWMTRCFASSEYLANFDEADSYANILKRNTQLFREDNSCIWPK